MANESSLDHLDLVNHKSDGNLLDAKSQNNKCEGVQNFNGDGNEDGNEKFSTGVEDDLATSSVETSENEFHSRKRKRESLSGMINWTKNIAIHPFDPEEYKGGQDFLDQMLWARDVLSVRKHAEPDSGSSSKKVKKMHPSMYEDPVVKLRYSQRQPVPSKPRCSCCISLSVAGNKLHGFITEKKKSTAKAVVNKKKKSKPSVGHRFQAELPQCTGVVYESDSKCLGTQVWPVNEDSKPTTETDLVGRERRGMCSCKVQGSADCVRFHIGANRTELKLELGSAFYHMGFDKMGEEVKFGSFGDGFGRKAIKHPSTDFMECSENTQCFDFE
ncbi:hypothetical protein MtrunA17_Chr6g0479271 [Medicago truncatula]|uniref:Uncharacterized protein n=1 Tax=Medicago truncatula TaxID=3880 RepID=A0A396HIA3_MEDTR|nr:AT-rich interactive domain-containing protein 2 [Medicago truncatula]XP_039682697.1 AT-rich interactive domain-containing protein 2 [Medicago truncatula]XP_039682698.1 AT-rich interactive domain-containing protein 2 [Medicago truncatula]XP_039682699.1 AT-rich interactive domain-containing protein 2 [Medicago truncatula]RHN52323.1 hypothetical protein MtrunA17_Chr6g0479271 [Medicago truncatula]